MAETSDTFDLSLLDEVFAKYEGKKGALIPILQRAQAIYGYLPVEVLQCIADRLEHLPGQGLRRRHLLRAVLPPAPRAARARVCDGTACHVKGAPALLTAVEDEYGIGADATTEDGQLTMEIVYCMGSCALAPVTVMDGQVDGPGETGDAAAAAQAAGGSGVTRGRGTRRLDDSGAPWRGIAMRRLAELAERGGAATSEGRGEDTWLC